MGALTAEVNDNPQKVNGMAGVTLGACASPLIYRFSDPDSADSII